MNYGEFINIFNKDYNLDYFYVLFLKKRKEVIKILKEEADNNFLEFLLKNKIEKEEEIKVFFDLYNNKFNLDSVYLCYIYNFVNLKKLKEIKNMDNLKYIVLNKYKNYLREDINKIDIINLENIIIFLWKYPKFYRDIRGNKYFGNIDLYNDGIEKDLTFLRILGIEEVEGDFNCSYNSNLKSLKGSPRKIKGNFYCKNCELEELGMQEGVEIGGDFDCSNNKKLKNLKYCPQEVDGSFVCYDCGLEELGMQEGVWIGENFNCSNNDNLKSLKGSPKVINNSFYCIYCKLNEIDLDKDITIGKNLICLEGNNVTKEQVEEYIRKNNINFKGEIK